MEVKFLVDDIAGALAASLGKFLADVDAAAVKAGHPTGSPEYLALLQAAVGDLVPALGSLSAAMAGIKSQPLQFGLALAVGFLPVASV